MSIELLNEETRAVDNVAGHDKQMIAIDEEIGFLVVNDQDSVDLATKLIREAKGYFKEAETDRREIVDPINESVKKINAKYKPIKDFVEKIERIGKAKIREYLQRVAKEKADREAEERRIAEKERLRKEKLAEKAVERGDFEKAEEHRQKADEVPVPVVEVEAETSAGSHEVTTWHHDVTSKEELILAVADTIRAKRTGEVLPVMIPTEAIQADEKYLRGVAKGVKDTVRWPGVRFYSKTDITVRG